MENINLSGNCLKTLLLCSSNTTQHNSLFFEILIFENLCSENIFPNSKSLIILENISLSRNWHKSLLLYSPNLTQHIFLFSNFEFLKFFYFFLGDLFFENYLTFGIRACGTILSAFNTAQHKFFFLKKQNGGAEIFAKIMVSSKTIHNMGFWFTARNCMPLGLPSTAFVF